MDRTVGGDRFSGGADRTCPPSDRRDNQDGDSIAAAAAEFGVGWHTANQAVADYTDPHVDDPGRLVGVEAIGVDEKRFLNATPTSRTRYTTQIVDLHRHRVLDVLEGRSRDVVGDWLFGAGNRFPLSRRSRRRNSDGLGI